ERPFPGLKEKLALFGQFIGDWVIEEARYPRGAHGVELRSQGEIHFGWILDGRAVQDVFMTRDPEMARAVPIGTTVRFYDPKMDAWQSVWISPVQELVQTFIGRKIGDEIVLESKTRDGYPEKWIFSEITKNSFRLHAEESHDHGNTWILTEEMRVRRRTSPGRAES
ncbi:MAG TPA: hypothetical protein VGA48_06080, partial [Thermoplasmata archaeon]